MKANEDAYCWYRNPANFDALVKIMKKAVPVPALNDEQYAAMVKKNLPSFGVSITSKSLQTWQELLVKGGQLKTTYDRSALVSNEAPETYDCGS